MADFKFDSNGDLDITNGKISLVSRVEDRVAQRLKIKFGINRGEWKFNTDFGINYITAKGEQSILYKAGKGYFDSVVKGEILEDDDVIEITSYTSSWDKEFRNYIVYAEVSTNSGDIKLTLEI